MAINPSTGLEDPIKTIQPVKPPTANGGLIDGNLMRTQGPGNMPTPTGTVTNTGTIETTPITSGSVSDQLDQILAPTPALGATSTATATPWNVTPEQTVQGQLAGIIDSKALSPLMERAQALNSDESNARGLINTSMGVQGGTAAVLDRALPIATQDATIRANAGQFNADTDNKTSQFNATNTQQNSQFNASEINKQNMQLLDNENKVKLMEMDNQYKTLVTQNQGAAGLYDTYQKAINGILTSTTMNEETKQSAINMQMQMMQAGMQMYSDVNSLGIDDLVNNTSNVQAETLPARQAAFDARIAEYRNVMATASSTSTAYVQASARLTQELSVGRPAA